MGLQGKKQRLTASPIGGACPMKRLAVRRCFGSPNTTIYVKGLGWKPTGVAYIKEV
jgi:hypothetical protein